LRPIWTLICGSPTLVAVVAALASTAGSASTAEPKINAVIIAFFIYSSLDRSVLTTQYWPSGRV
jgi:zinc transporter ZupT